MATRRTRLRVLRAAQADRLISQMALARRAGVPTFRYWQIENGEGPAPSVGEQVAIAAALGTSVAAIAWPDVHPRERAS